MSLGDRFCMSRKGGTGGVGWVNPKGANRPRLDSTVERSWSALGVHVPFPSFLA